MTENTVYYADDICEILNISNYTLSNWYRWERKLMKEGEINETYLPQPQYEISIKGKPRYWTKEQVEALREYQKSIVRGRNGVFGKFTNPLHNKKED